MRHILHILAATVTRHPREVIEPVWSKSWVYNAFRVYEYLFGRRSGIRPEGGFIDGVTYSYTWEHLLSTYEGMLRALFKRNLPKFSIVYIPHLQLAGVSQGGVTPFRFAIAYDNSAEVATGSNASSLSGAYTVTGSNPLLLASSWGNIGSSNVTGMTYNSAALTAVTNVVVPTDRAYDVYIKQAPSTGSNTLVVNATNSLYSLGAASYSGCAQTGQPDNSNTTTVSGNATLSGSITVNTANSWVVFFTDTRGFTLTSESNVTARLNVGNQQICDSNTALATGSFSCSVTISNGSYSMGGVLVSIKPVTASVINPLPQPFFFQ